MFLIGGFVFLHHALENKEFNKGECGAKEEAAEQTDVAAFHTADNTEESNEADCAKHSLFNLDGNCGCEECNDRANEGDQLISNVYGVIIRNNYCSVCSLIVCVHIRTVLSKFGFMKREFS